MTDRRHFLRILSTVAASPIAAWAARSPIKLAHASPEACVEDTKKNVAFVMKNLS